jgi:hypothetical protein
MAGPTKRVCPNCGTFYWPRLGLEACAKCGAKLGVQDVTPPRDWSEAKEFVSLKAEVRIEGEPGNPAQVLRELSPCCDLTPDLTKRMHALIKDIQGHLQAKGQL